MLVKQVESMAEIDPVVWNRLAGDHCPFLRHEFLSALETSGPVSRANGWEAKHLLVFDGDQAIAAMPYYLKYHSYGEFVFDQAWAEAYQRQDLRYYPKGLTAIPFTPCQGSRILIHDTDRLDCCLAALFDFIKQFSDRFDLSSWHCLFPDMEQATSLKNAGLAIREGVQFQWRNNDYRDFADFLDTFSASKRKMIKRERRKVRESGIELVRLPGSAVTGHQWRVFYDCYQMTYIKHGMHPYLNLEFFLQCASVMPDRLMLVLALKKDDIVGSALSFIGRDTLYGRYWGCRDEYDFLHFEACYYQGLDYCIEHGLRRFDSGAQGEHKIARGFEPVTTYSAHWLKDENFADAVKHFLAREQKAVHNYRIDAAGYLPYKKKQRMAP